jgi:hypothetical protein
LSAFAEAAVTLRRSKQYFSAINRYNRQLFDLLVGAQQNRWRYRKAERLGGLEVQDHLKILSAA